MTVQILPGSSFRQMPWKNGGGVTTEIAISPEGSTLETFDWRVSMADVVADGPFSSFPEIDRTLSVLEGKGITLVFGENHRVHLSKDSEPLSFAADAPVAGQLDGGPIRDLNVMSRRGRIEHRVTRHQLTTRITFPVRGAVLLLLAHGAALEISFGRTVYSLPNGDGLMATGWHGQDVVLSGGGTVYAIEFCPSVSQS